MPRVPTLEQRVGQKAPTSQGVNLNTPLEALGGGATAQRLGGAINNASSVIFKEIENQRKKANDTALTEAETALMKRQGELKVEINQLKGKDAYGSAEYLNTEWEKATREISQGLSTEELRSRFKLIEQRKFISSNTHAYQHTEIEGDKHEVETLENNLIAYRNNAALNYGTANNPAMADQIKVSIQEVSKKINDFAENNGKTDQWVKNNITNQTSKIHSDVIKSKILNGQDLAAEEYFKDHKKEFTADDRLKMEAAVTKNSLLANSQKLSQKYVGETTSESAAITMARKENKEPRLQKSIVDDIKMLYGEKRAADKERKKLLFENYYDELLQGTTTYNPKDPRIIAMDFSQVEAIKRVSAKKVDKSSTKEFKRLLDLQYNDPEKFSQIDIMKESGSKLSKADLSKFMKSQYDSKERTNSTTVTAHVNRTFMNMDIGADEQSSFRMIFDEELNKYPKEERNSSKTFNEINEFLFQEASVEGDFFDPLVWEALAKKKKIINVDDRVFDRIRPAGAPPNTEFSRMTIEGKRENVSVERLGPNTVRVYRFDGSVFTMNLKEGN